MDKETQRELEIRLSSNVYYLEELIKQIGNVDIESNGDTMIDLREVIDDLEDIRNELDLKENDNATAN